MRLRTIFTALVVITFSSATFAQDIAAELAQATKQLDTTEYELSYQLGKGEQIRYDVDQRATVDTKISGNQQKSESTTKSVKVWDVTGTTANSITFEYSIDSVDMWQKEEGRAALSYDSTKDKEPPVAFHSVAEKLQKTLATITIDRHGNVIKRDRGSGAPDLGFGGPVVPLPSKPVRLNQTWSVPKKLLLRNKAKVAREVKLQVKYRLEQVKSGVATISVRTEVLTALDDAALKSQLVQQLSNGTIRFDMDAGRVLSKQLEWNENVIGFDGPSSNMKYLARFTEQLQKTRSAKAITEGLRAI